MIITPNSGGSQEVISRGLRVYVYPYPTLASGGAGMLSAPLTALELRMCRSLPMGCSPSAAC